MQCFRLMMEEQKNKQSTATEEDSFQDDDVKAGDDASSSEDEVDDDEDAKISNKHQAAKEDQEPEDEEKDASDGKSRVLKSIFIYCWDPAHSGSWSTLLTIPSFWGFYFAIFRETKIFDGKISLTKLYKIYISDEIENQDEETLNDKSISTDITVTESYNFAQNYIEDAQHHLWCEITFNVSTYLNKIFNRLNISILKLENKGKVVL